MSKIISVINSMISNEDLITDITLFKNEYFFLFDNKYVWSIQKNSFDSNVYITFYPGQSSLIQLFELINAEVVCQKMYYSADDYKGWEANESFIDLLTIIQEKSLGIDVAFDDILSY